MKTIEKVKIPELKLIGIQLAKKTTKKNGQSMNDCGNLWQEFERSQNWNDAEIDIFVSFC